MNENKSNRRNGRRLEWHLRCRPQHTGYSGVAKVDVSEDPEPSLSKVDVILTFTLEVRNRLLLTARCCTTLHRPLSIIA